MGRINSYSDIRITRRDEALKEEREKDQKFDQRWAEQQAIREGLTLGYGGKSANKSAEIDDYARRIEKVVGRLGKDYARKFRPGFKQRA
jgi:hypothetical protein